MRPFDEMMDKMRDPAWVKAHSVEQPERYLHVVGEPHEKTDQERLADMLVPPLYAGVPPAVAVPDRGVLYTGRPGVGKTWRAVSEGLALSIGGKSVLWLSMPAYMAAHRAHEYTPPLSEIRWLDAVLLDDIAQAKPPEWMRETLYALIDTLLNNTVLTIATSNCDRLEIARRYGDPIASRLAALCPDTVPIEGSDRRLFGGDGR